jgi:hypothetical protein
MLAFATLSPDLPDHLCRALVSVNGSARHDLQKTRVSLTVQWRRWFEIVQIVDHPQPLRTLLITNTLRYKDKYQI